MDIRIFDEEQISVSLLSSTKLQILLDLAVVATAPQTPITSWQLLPAGAQLLSPIQPNCSN